MQELLKRYRSLENAFVDMFANDQEKECGDKSRALQTCLDDECCLRSPQETMAKLGEILTAHGIDPEEVVEVLRSSNKEALKKGYDFSMHAGRIRIKGCYPLSIILDAAAEVMK